PPPEPGRRAVGRPRTASCTVLLRWPAPFPARTAPAAPATSEDPSRSPAQKYQLRTLTSSRERSLPLPARFRPVAHELRDLSWLFSPWSPVTAGGFTAPFVAVGGPRVVGVLGFARTGAADVFRVDRR